MSGLFEQRSIKQLCCSKINMMKKLIYLICLIAISLWFQSCYNDNEEEIYGVVTCDVTEITYANDVQPIINSSCATTACHASGGSAPGNFTNFNELTDKVDNGSFVNRVLVQKTMPPNSELSNCELEILQAWIDGGALNN